MTDNRWRCHKVGIDFYFPNHVARLKNLYLNVYGTGFS